MNLFLRELKANRKALIIWSVCMVIVILGGMGKYTAFAKGDASSQVINELPRTFKALFGIGDFDLTKMSGFYALLFLYIELAAAVHAVLLGSGILSKEECDKTAEFLATKPISRTAIVTSKLLAALVNVLILNLVILVSSIAVVPIYDKGEGISREIVLFLLSLFFVQMIFFSLGTLLASILQKPKRAGTISSGIMVGAFVLSEITSLTDRLDPLNILSPFKYFSYSEIVSENSLDVSAVLLSLFLIALFTSLTYLYYRKRDLNL